MIESIEELRTFCQVVEEGSLSAAARSLSLSVNAVSRRLVLLERRLGARLAERTTRTFALTDEGQRFYDRCRRILGEIEDAEEELTPSGDGLRGLVRIAVFPSVIQAPLLAGLETLLADNDGLRIHVLARNTPIDPVRDGVDLAIWPGEVTSQAVTARKIVDAAWSLACTPGYADRFGLPNRPDDLGRHQCLRAIKDRPEHTWVLRDSRGREIVVRPGGRFDSDDTETLRLALYAGLGIGLRPRGEVREAARAGVLVHVLPRYTFRVVPVHLVAPHGRLRLRRVRAVAELLERVMSVIA